jgi:hypothetical protein
VSHAIAGLPVQKCHQSATKNFVMVVEVRDGEEAERGSRHQIPP